MIRAPFNGRVGLRQVSVGSLVEPGAVITTLDDISTIKLDFSVPEMVVVDETGTRGAGARHRVPASGSTGARRERRLARRPRDVR